MTATIALYSHDSVGLGHARRNRSVAFALAEQLPALTGEPTRGLLIAGDPTAAQDTLPEGWDWLILPGVQPGPQGYTAQHLGATLAETTRLRGEIVRTALETWAPELLIVDRHPYGVTEELAPALASLRRTPCRTVLGLRDVLDAADVVAGEWARVGGPARIARDIDQIWVHGDPEVHDLRESGELPSPLAERARFTGYLSLDRPASTTSRDGGTDVFPPYVLTVLGGGSDGADLADRAVRAEVPAGCEHLLVAGPQMPRDQVARLRRIAAPSARVLHHVPDVPELIAGAEGVLAMAGYNTSAEIMATTTPALLVPRNTRRAEQPLRARALARVGAVETADVADLRPEDLAAWFARARGRTTDRRRIARDGLARVAQLAQDALAGSHSPVVTVPDGTTPGTAPSPSASGAAPSPLASVGAPSPSTPSREELSRVL